MPKTYMRCGFWGFLKKTECRRHRVNFLMYNKSIVENMFKTKTKEAEILKKDKYISNVLPKIEKIGTWYENGLDDEQIARRLGICCRTLKKYKQEHKELAEAMDIKRVTVIKDAENALIKKAKGYTYIEKKTVDKGDKIETTETEKEVPPDLSAISFLLRNLCPEKWSDKPTVACEEASGGGVVVLPEILQEEA